MERPEKRSVTLRGHRTSISLEPSFWSALQALATVEGLSVDALLSEIDVKRAEAEPPASLTSAVRVRILAEARRGRC